MSDRPIASAALATADVRLSAAALDAIVSGVALFPDSILADVLDAATHPIALHQAASEDRRLLPVGPLARAAKLARPESVQRLARYPDVLRVLDEHLMMTARLGVAFRTQPEEVWAAIARVRSMLEHTAGTDVVAVDTTVITNVCAKLCDDPVIIAEIDRCEVDAEVVAVVANGDVTVGGVVIEGEGGEVSAVGGVVAGTATVGDTTYGGVAAGGTVTGPNGTTVAGAGAAGGQITRTDSGATWSTGAVGGVANVDTGAYAAGVHSGSGSVQQNSDGSVDWERDATNAGTSSYGSGKVEHHGDAHVTGDGSGSYDGSTSIDSTAGSVDTQTHASNGQVATTVTDGQGNSTTYTAGDGQIENGKSARSTATPSSASQGRSFSANSPESIAQASRGVAESFGRLTRNSKSAATHTPPTSRSPASSLGGAKKPSPPKGGGMKKPGGRGGRR